MIYRRTTSVRIETDFHSGIINVVKTFSETFVYMAFGIKFGGGTNKLFLLSNNYQILKHSCELSGHQF